MSLKSIWFIMLFKFPIPLLLVLIIPCLPTLKITGEYCDISGHHYEFVSFSF